MPIRESLIRIRRLYWHLRAGLEWQVSSELSDCAAKRLADLPQQIAEKSLRRKLAALELLRRLELLRIQGRSRIGSERKIPAQLSDGAADLRAESLVAEQAADCAAERLADLPEQIAEESLWCK